MNVFIVTSAINSSFGLIDYPTRFNQLIESAKSIRAKTKFYTILVDGGREPINFTQRQSLLKYYDEIFDLTQHTFIHSVQNLPNLTSSFVRGPCEAYLMQHICEIIGDSVERIFKLSGRYTLTDEFDLDKLLNQKNKYVFKKRNSVTYPPFYDADTGQAFPYSPYQYQTRLYSICGSLINDAAFRFKMIKDTLVNIYSQGSFSIMEDAVFQLIPSELVFEVENIGVCGFLADENRYINE